MKISNIGLAALLFAAAPLAMSSTTLAQTTPGSSSAASGSMAQSPDSGSASSGAASSTSVPSASTGTPGKSNTPDVSADIAAKNTPLPNSTSTTTIAPRDNVTAESRELSRDGTSKGKLSERDVTKKGYVSGNRSNRDRSAARIDNDRTSGKKMDRAERRSNRSASHRSTQYRRDWAYRHQGRRWVGTGPAIGFGFGAPYSENRYYDDSFAFSPGRDDVAYCSARFRSYDPASGTYLGYDGFRHSCP